MNQPITILLAAVVSIPSFCVAQVQWTKYQDPYERAFRVDVPAGWTVRGGLFRLGYSDARAMVDLTSPDGRINVRLGDMAIPVYFAPNAAHSREGQIYDLGAQAQLIVARYRTAQEYAPLYARARFKTVCAGLTPQATGAGETMPDYAPEDVAARESSAAAAEFHCSDSRIAYAWARTSLYQGFWMARTLGSAIAPAGQAALARSILARCARSFEISPAWKHYQAQLDQQALVYQRQRQAQRLRMLGQQVAQFEMRMQAMRSQVNAFERQQARQADQVSSFTKTLTGLTPTIDPLGNPRDVWTGSRSGYWINGRGEVVNSDVSPGAGWQPMKVVQ